jgi:hypothetical protein
MDLESAEAAGGNGDLQDHDGEHLGGRLDSQTTLVGDCAQSSIIVTAVEDELESIAREIEVTQSKAIQTGRPGGAIPRRPVAHTPASSAITPAATADIASSCEEGRGEGHG